ncbi:Heat shock 105kDa 110kDa protein 1, variant 2 [Clonorchis sinensis]|uniref:Heat shock 105kDa 110kDa protein 1, variant 2 n=1 Tax=Clonorchis sinensis TaxID=79923 RepID=A0A8T1MAF4_CLOSI|nr:Heat shock 105kDa 110kDa protein 1, variant 2 [Clonorchis sinensis]
MKVDAATRIRVLRECEEAKKRMGLHKKQVTITVDSLPGERSVNVKMDRSMFEKASEQLLKRFEDTLRKSISNSVFDVQVVELVGGGVRVPAIKDSVQKVFGIAGQMTMNGDEALASGCALRAAAIQSPDDSNQCKIVILKETEEHKLSIDERVLKEYQTEFKRFEQGSRAHPHQDQQQQQQQQQLQREQQPIGGQSNTNNASGQLVSDFMERLWLIQEEAKSSLDSLNGDSSGYLQTNEVLGHYLKLTQLLSDLIANAPYSQISQSQMVQPATWNTLVKLQKNLRIEVFCDLLYLISNINPGLRIPINEEKCIFDEESNLTRLLDACAKEVKALQKHTERSFEVGEVLRSLEEARYWLLSRGGQYDYWHERYIRSFRLKRGNSSLWSFVENLQPHCTSEVSSWRVRGQSISLSTKVDEYAHQYLRLLQQWCSVRIEMTQMFRDYLASLRILTQEVSFLYVAQSSPILFCLHPTELCFTEVEVNPHKVSSLVAQFTGHCFVEPKLQSFP